MTAALPGPASGLVVGTLVTWRLSHLLVEEDGPCHLVARLRGAVDRTALAGLLDCFGCTSVWVGVVTAIGARGRRAGPVQLLITGLALSGSAFLLHKAVSRLDSPRWLPEPDVDSRLVTVAERRG